MALTSKPAPFKLGDRVVIVGEHPHTGAIGELVAYEPYGMGWEGWRVIREDGHGEFYADRSVIRHVPNR